MEPDFEDLLHTALWDTGGEMVEGAFVDRWEPYSLQAIDEILKLLEGRALTSEEIAFVRSEIASPEVPLSNAANLLWQLREKGAELVAGLAQTELPHLRELYFQVVGQSGHEADWSSGLRDPNPRVRATALEQFYGRNRQSEAALSAIEAAMSDPDPLVRSAATRIVPFIRNSQGADALADLLDRETNDTVRRTALTRLAEEVNRIGISAPPERVAEGLGARLAQHLIAALDVPWPPVREVAVRALNRLDGAAIADAVLDRLLVEQEPMVRGTLLLYGGYRQIYERAFPVLADLTANGTEMERTRAAFLLENFGPAAELVLRQALRDPPTRRAAAMSLGKAGGIRSLADLAREYGDPENRRMERELERAVNDVAIKAAHGPPPDPIDSTPILRRAIDALPPRTWENYPVGAVKETFDALPVMSTMIDIWSIRADGRVLETDFESVRLETEEVDDPLTVFAVFLRAAMANPELEPLLMPPPKEARVCTSCRGVGLQGEGVCGRCRRLGWVLQR